MNTTSTIKTISESSNLLWDLLCKIEDGEISAKDAHAQLSADDRVILWEEVADMDRKARTAAAYEPKTRPHFNAEEACKVSRYEYMILARQEADTWTA